MTDGHPVDCTEFDAGADELAVGGLSEPERSRLLGHAATCARCDALLNELASVADRILLLGPSAEPPAGFEVRALAAMGIGADQSTDTASPRLKSRRRRLATPASLLRRAAVAAAVAVALVAGAVVGHGIGHGPALASRQAAIMSAAGTRVGTMALVSRPRPHVVIALDAPRPAPGRLTCALERRDGSWVTVGSWTYAEIDSGVWAVGIQPQMLTAVAMRVTTDTGAVVATART